MLRKFFQELDDQNNAVLGILGDALNEWTATSTATTERASGYYYHPTTQTPTTTVSLVSPFTIHPHSPSNFIRSPSYEVQLPEVQLIGSNSSRLVTSR